MDTQRINLELSTVGGESSDTFTTTLKNPIRVFTHPFRIKLSSLRIRQITRPGRLTFKFDMLIKKKGETSASKIGNHEGDIPLTENHYKNFRSLTRFFKRLPFHEEVNDMRTHYHHIPEFIYDGHSVTLRLIMWPKKDDNDDQLFIQFSDNKIADMLGVTLNVLNARMKDQVVTQHVFNRPNLPRVPDLYIHCSIASSIGYNKMPNGLIRIVRIPQDRDMVHIDFDDDLWATGKNDSEINEITIKLLDSNGRAWRKYHNECSLVLTLEGNLYKTNREPVENSEPMKK